MKTNASSKNTTVLLLVVLVLAVLFALYYYVVLPKQDEVASIESSISTLNTEIAALDTQIAELQAQQTVASGDEFEMRKKLPDNREIDSLLLNIEEIEILTDSRILNINFNNYDALVNASTLQDPNTVVPVEGEEAAATEAAEAVDAAVTATENPEAAETEATTEGQAETPVTTIAAQTLPPSLKLVTFSIEVAAPNYQQLQLFIKEIEKIQRIMRIDTIEFALPGEENAFIADATDVVNATVQVTTFFYE